MTLRSEQVKRGAKPYGRVVISTGTPVHRVWGFEHRFVWWAQGRRIDEAEARARELQELLAKQKIAYDMLQVCWGGGGAV